MELRETTALVAGGSGTVGRATVAALARAGADVVVGYHTDEAGADAAVERAREAGREATAVAADLTDPGETAALVEAAAGRFDSRFGVLADCSGRTDPRALEELDRDTLSGLLETNVTGSVGLAREAVRRFRETGGGGGDGEDAGGSVVLVTSVAAEMGTVDAGYATAKAGLHGFVRALARECGADGIRVNAVVPGPVESPMNDDVLEHLEATRFRGHRTVDTLLDRYEAQPEEVAAAVRFLATQPFVTGEFLHVDGGMSL
jgi:3-oxoacyl-[acyl-carrier protein] reductase